ncbi:oxidoreductase [Aureimonas sp. Leaf454]|uniref:NAD(P)/FAD-dependent oxidoreductase n=1 Tax=Aureimonas sp. Leaf454 TaxID=1736381 RepID=UPI0006F9BCA3|nr:FAD-binding oxidoreductase [Aureimonas sp. Leaf454]KQT52367.1 oxidoreductase [Aureimonas sp. Leaf454]
MAGRPADARAPESAYQSPISPGRSWYEDSVPDRPRYPRLEGDLKTDVLVVGGGFTGLSAATHLAAAGIDVAVVEAARFGDGASGRNGGQMGTGQRLWSSEIAEAYGLERAKALFALAEDAKAHLLEFTAAHGIDVDFRPGQLSVAHKKRYVADYEAQVEDLAVNYDYRRASFMGPAETAERLGSQRYFGGMNDEGTGHLHPLKLLIGTAKVAHAAGARLFEETPILSLTGTGAVLATTATGRIRARRALLATNAHGGGLNDTAARHIMPIRSFIGATEPLAEPQRVLPGEPSVDDSRFSVRYFRKSVDGRLLFGGREAYTSESGDISAHIRRQIAEVYPHLAAVPITHAWGGSVGITMERLPYVREVEPGITAIGGFSGHGVIMANFAGRLYAERLSGNRDRLNLLEDLEISAFPGGKSLRTPLLVLAMTWYALRDRF